MAEDPQSAAALRAQEEQDIERRQRELSTEAERITLRLNELEDKFHTVAQTPRQNQLDAVERRTLTERMKEIKRELGPLTKRVQESREATQAAKRNASLAAQQLNDTRQATRAAFALLTKLRESGALDGITPDPETLFATLEDPLRRGDLRDFVTGLSELNQDIRAAGAALLPDFHQAILTGQDKVGDILLGPEELPIARALEAAADSGDLQKILSTVRPVAELAEIDPATQQGAVQAESRIEMSANPRFGQFRPSFNLAERSEQAVRELPGDTARRVGASELGIDPNDPRVGRNFFTNIGTGGEIVRVVPDEDVGLGAPITADSARQAVFPGGDVSRETFADPGAPADRFAPLPEDRFVSPEQEAQAQPAFQPEPERNLSPLQQAERTAASAVSRRFGPEAQERLARESQFVKDLVGRGANFAAENLRPLSATAGGFLGGIAQRGAEAAGFQNPRDVLIQAGILDPEPDELEVAEAFPRTPLSQPSPSARPEPAPTPTPLPTPQPEPTPLIAGQVPATSSFRAAFGPASQAAIPAGQDRRLSPEEEQAILAQLRQRAVLGF